MKRTSFILSDINNSKILHEETDYQEKVKRIKVLIKMHQILNTELRNYLIN